MYTRNVYSFCTHCRNLPFGGRARGAHGCVFQERKMRGVRAPPYNECELKHTNKPIVFYYSNLKSGFIWISIMQTIRFAVHIMHI